MNSSTTGATTTIGTSCTNYQGGQVTITVPSSGTIVVQAQLWVILRHVFGMPDHAFLLVGNSTTDCSSSGSFWWPVDVPGEMPSSGAYHGAFPQRWFPVAAGTYTFYLNGFMSSGQDPLDVFYYANMLAVFYPS